MGRKKNRWRYFPLSVWFNKTMIQKNPSQRHRGVKDRKKTMGYSILCAGHFGGKIQDGS